MYLNTQNINNNDRYMCTIINVINFKVVPTKRHATKTFQGSEILKNLNNTVDLPKMAYFFFTTYSKCIVIKECE